MKIFVLVIDSEYGTSISAYTTQAALDKYLYQYVVESWHDLGDAQAPETFKIPADAVSHYFENHVDEWRVSEEVEVEN